MATLSNERMSEIVTNLAKAGAKSSEVESFQYQGKRAGVIHTINMDVSMPEALVSAGLCKDESEAKSFLNRVLNGALFGAHSGVLDEAEMAQHIMQTGFVIGLATYAKQKEVV
jgi:hypothetical protein